MTRSDVIVKFFGALFSDRKSLGVITELRIKG